MTAADPHLQSCARVCSLSRRDALHMGPRRGKSPHRVYVYGNHAHGVKNMPLDGSGYWVFADKRPLAARSVDSMDESIGLAGDFSPLEMRGTCLVPTPVPCCGRWLHASTGFERARWIRVHTSTRLLNVRATASYTGGSTGCSVVPMWAPNQYPIRYSSTW